MSNTARFTSDGLVAIGGHFPRQFNVSNFRKKEIRFAAEILYANPMYSLLGPEDQTTAKKEIELAFRQWLVNHKRTSSSNERCKYMFIVQKTLDSIEEQAELPRVGETMGVIPFSQLIKLTVQPKAIIFPGSRFPFSDVFGLPPIHESWQIPPSSAFPPPPSSSIQEGGTSGNPPEEGLMFKRADPTLMSIASFEMVLANQEVRSTLAEIWETMSKISDLSNTDPDTYLGPIDFFGTPDSLMS